MSNRAFYSIIQYCPDRFRAETVNVGLILFQNHEGTLVKYKVDRKRIREFLGTSEPEFDQMIIALDGIMSIADQIESQDELEDLARTRANDIRLTKPRLVKIGDDMISEMERLFLELVEA